MSVLSAVCVILGRAGSKGVPGKNVRAVGGKPCAAWTVEAALASGRLGATAAERGTRVCVSSDDARLLEMARGFGCAGVERPGELAGDRATVDDAARHAVRAMESRGDWRLGARSAVVILYANVPVRPGGLIDCAVEMFERTGCDSVQSYAPVGKMHPWWMARVEGDDGRVRAWEGEVLNHGVYRRQDLPGAYVPDGGVLVVSRAALMGEIAGVQAGPHGFFGKDRRGVITEAGAVVDIDSEIDVVVADAVLRGSAGGMAGGAVTGVRA